MTKKSKNKSIREVFAANLRKIRIKAGLSQEKLAEIANLHRTYISSVEREDRNVSLDNIEKLAIALKTTPARLLEDLHDSEK
jgi:transcriptional regulator with XRE-family HTH domain